MGENFFVFFVFRFDATSRDFIRKFVVWLFFRICLPLNCENLYLLFNQCYLFSDFHAFMGFCILLFNMDGTLEVSDSKVLEKKKILIYSVIFPITIQQVVDKERFAFLVYGCVCQEST
jgi:hypothetical protein